MTVSKLDPKMGAMAGDTAELEWRQPGCPPFRLAGFPWFAQDHAWRRLPLAPREAIPAPVDTLANCPAGGQVSFQSDSTEVAVKVELELGDSTGESHTYSTIAHVRTNAPLEEPSEEALEEEAGEEDEETEEGEGTDEGEPSPPDGDGRGIFPETGDTGTFPFG